MRDFPDGGKQLNAYNGIPPQSAALKGRVSAVQLRPWPPFKHTPSWVEKRTTRSPDKSWVVNRAIFAAAAHAHRAADYLNQKVASSFPETCAA